MGQKRLPRLPPGTPRLGSPRLPRAGRGPPGTERDTETGRETESESSLPSLTPRSPLSSGSPGSPGSPGSSRSRSSRSPRVPRSSAGGAFARHHGDAGDTARSRGESFGTRSPRSRRPAEIKVVVERQADSHPLGTYTASPRIYTNTELRIARRERDKPHPSMDVDGDGTVSQFDFKLANQFDADGNRILDEKETAKLRAMMAKKNVEDIAKMMSAARKSDPEFEKIKTHILGDRYNRANPVAESVPGGETVVLRNAFAALDPYMTGKVAASDLGRIAADLGRPMSGTEVAEVMKEIDADRSGKMDFDEFKTYWARCKQRTADGGDYGNLFGGLDLRSEEFRYRIDAMAAKARELNTMYASSGAKDAMDQTRLVAPASAVPGKVYGEHVNGKEAYLTNLQPHAHLGPRTKIENGVLGEADAALQSQEAVREKTPELWAKGSDVFRMVAAKMESKTGNLGKLFRKFDTDGDGTYSSQYILPVSVCLSVSLSVCLRYIYIPRSR